MGGSNGSLWEVCPSRRALGEQRRKHTPAGSRRERDIPAAGVRLRAPSALSQEERLVLDQRWRQSPGRGDGSPSRPLRSGGVRADRGVPRPPK